jgi:hypothetical protein
VCHAHKTKWCVGANLFSTWHNENEQTWAENAQRLRGYTEVEPLPCNDHDGGSDGSPGGDQSKDPREEFVWAELSHAGTRIARGSEENERRELEYLRDLISAVANRRMNEDSSLWPVRDLIRGLIERREFSPLKRDEMGDEIPF